jgi:hypothetical protein
MRITLVDALPSFRAAFFSHFAKSEHHDVVDNHQRLFCVRNARTGSRRSFVTLTTTTPGSEAAVAVTNSTHLSNAILMSAGEILPEDLSEMIDEFVSLLERLADEQSSQKKNIVFSINNLDQVVSILQERRVVGKEFNKFVELLMQQREYFVEVELLTGFSKMIAFVHQTEADLAVAPKASYQVNIQEVEALVLDFASNWKTNIDLINRSVLSYFSNFRNGMKIPKQVLTQLLLYYTRFQDFIQKVWRNKLPPFCKDLVSTSAILGMPWQSKKKKN